MQNSNIRVYILLIMSTLLLSSCFKERIELDLNEGNKKIVIVAWISTLEEEQSITIHRTVNYLGADTPQAVSEAIVSLSNGSETYDLPEVTAGKYVLPSDWQAIIGSTYELNVLVEDQEFKATHKLFEAPEIVNLRQFQSGKKDSIRLYSTLFEFTDFPGLGDAYYGVDYLKGSASGDSLQNGSFTDDEFLDGETLEDIELTDSDRRFQIGDTAVVELFSIGQETSTFLTNIDSELYFEGPFAPPPSNVGTNFTGGAIGYFIISDARQAMIVIE